MKIGCLFLGPFALVAIVDCSGTGLTTKPSLCMESKLSSGFAYTATQLNISNEKDSGNASFVRIKQILSINQDPFVRQCLLQPDSFSLADGTVFPGLFSFA